MILGKRNPSSPVVRCPVVCRPVVRCPVVRRLVVRCPVVCCPVVSSPKLRNNDSDFMPLLHERFRQFNDANGSAVGN